MNAQSLVGKFEAVKNDWNLNGCSIVGIVDTRFTSGKEREVDFRFLGNFLKYDARPSLNIAVYNDVPYFGQKHCRLKDDMGTLIALKYPLTEDNYMSVCFVYILPGANNSIFEALAELIKKELDIVNQFIVVMGDFNRNPEDVPLVFQNLFPSQLIKGITHNRGNTLDHIYTNFNEHMLEWGRLNSLTKTDHFPLFLTLKAEKSIIETIYERLN